MRLSCFSVKARNGRAAYGNHACFRVDRHAAGGVMHRGTHFDRVVRTFLERLGHDRAAESVGSGLAPLSVRVKEIPQDSPAFMQGRNVVGCGSGRKSATS